MWDLDKEIAQGRRDKEAAIKRPGLRERGGAARKGPQLLSGKAAWEQEWAALPSLREEIERLRDLLRRHGIDLQDDAA
jgi:hypothetical protein